MLILSRMKQECAPGYCVRSVVSQYPTPFWLEAFIAASNFGFHRLVNCPFMHSTINASLQILPNSILSCKIEYTIIFEVHIMYSEKHQTYTYKPVLANNDHTVTFQLLHVLLRGSGVSQMNFHNNIKSPGLSALLSEHLARLT